MIIYLKLFLALTVGYLAFRSWGAFKVLLFLIELSKQGPLTKSNREVVILSGIECLFAIAFMTGAAYFGLFIQNPL